MNRVTNKADEFAKLSTFERIAYGSGDLAQNLVFGTVGGFLLTYLTTVNGISAVAGATIFLIVKWGNVFWDPFVGAFIDKSKPSAQGKYRPYLLKFGIPLVVLASLLFLPLESVRGSVIYAFLSYFATAMVYSFVNIPYGSLSASLTRDTDEIAKLTTTRMTMANIANLFVYTLFPLFVQLLAPHAELKNTGFFGIELYLGDYMSAAAGPAWFKVYAVYMVIGFVALMLSYFGTKERIIPTAEETDKVKYSDLVNELKRNRPLQILGLFFLIGFTFMFFGNTVWPFYLKYNIGHSEWIASVGLLGSIPGIFVLGQLCLWVWQFDSFKYSPTLGYIGRFLQQWGLTSATGFMWALVPEVVTFGEFKSKKRVAGIINALMGLFFKIGLALGGIIPGYINAVYGFNGSLLAQTEEALFGINLSMIWAPIILAIIAGFVMSRYPLSDTDIDHINEKITAYSK
ncbi:MFS transporter [Mannheimia haemolytica]|uniref:MFS transporter n=1 Tax=Mannheimia haemolytica TaxID=75985 RepID=UPI00201C0BF1|nr:MFS transporter [Mannheimia haemolytica]UQX77152.1 MFS transporter [Mannheimia haemolytica]